MSDEGSVSSTVKPILNMSVFLRTLIPPLIVWGVIVAVVTLGGQPGVVCVTPMAWLLALWCGTQYIRLSKGQAERRRLFGPALVGALLGTGEGIYFTLVVSLSMPPSTPDDAVKTQALIPIIYIAGIIACAALSVFTAWLSLRRDAAASRIRA